MLSSPAGLLPASIPVDCTRGLYNYPIPTISSGATICLPGPVDLLHEVIFHRPHVADLPAAMIVEKLESASADKETGAEVRFIDVTAKVVDPLPAPAADVSEFAYANTRLCQLTPTQRSSFTLAVERLMDNALAFILNEIDNSDQSKAGLSFFSALNAIRQGKTSAATTNNRPKREPLQPYRGPVSDERHRAEVAHFAKLMREMADIDVSSSGQSDRTDFIDGEHRYRLYSGYKDWKGIIVERRVGGDWRFTHAAFTKKELSQAMAAVDADYERLKSGAGRFSSPFEKGEDGRTAAERRAAGRINDLNYQAAQNVANKIFGPNQNVSVANG